MEIPGLLLSVESAGSLLGSRAGRERSEEPLHLEQQMPQ